MAKERVSLHPSLFIALLFLLPPLCIYIYIYISFSLLPRIPILTKKNHGIAYMILLLLESKDTRSIVSKIKFTRKEVHYTRENRNMDESFDMIRKDMRNLKIRGGCNRRDEKLSKTENHSSIPLTIHATESIIQLPISHLGVDFTRSQETRIEFASRGRDPDLSSLIDGAREIGGGVVKCKGEGRFSFFLSFFFPPPRFGEE